MHFQSSLYLWGRLEQARGKFLLITMHKQDRCDNDPLLNIPWINVKTDGNNRQWTVHQEWEFFSTEDAFYLRRKRVNVSEEAKAAECESEWRIGGSGAQGRNDEGLRDERRLLRNTGMTRRSTCAWRVCMLRGSRGCPNAVAKRRWIRNEGVEGTWEVCRRNRKDSWLARKTTKSWNEWIEKTERQREDQGGLFSWKKGKEEEKKASSSCKVQILDRWAFFFSSFASLSSAGGIQGPGISGRLDKKKRKKGPGHLLEQGRANSSSGASQHSSTRQKKRGCSQQWWTLVPLPHTPFQFALYHHHTGSFPGSLTMTTGKPER